MKKSVLIICLFFANFLVASVRIDQLSGEVKIRRGLDENWQTAHAGMDLEPLDTILTGEKGRVKLRLAEGGLFTLGANAILDIADLRRISKRELFLIITSEKIELLPQRKAGSGMQIENVNILHGEKKVEKKNRQKPDLKISWLRNRNGGIDLLEQQFYSNAIVKFHKMLKKFIEVKDCGEIYYYLGQAFEGLQNDGQALENYSNALQQNLRDDCVENADAIRRASTKEAIKRLK